MERPRRRFVISARGREPSRYRAESQRRQVHDDAPTGHMARREGARQSPWGPPERRSFRAGRVLSLSRRNFRATEREKLVLSRGEVSRVRRTA